MAKYSLWLLSLSFFAFFVPRILSNAERQPSVQNEGSSPPRTAQDKDPSQATTDISFAKNAITYADTNAILHCETPGMKRHYERWMEMIIKSDYVKQNATMMATKEDKPDKTKKPEDQTRHRVLAEVLFNNPTKKKNTSTPQPSKTSPKCECGHYNHPRPRIVGGSETYEHRYPWMVSVQLARERKHFCGASIISPNYVLTAAHCTDGLSPNDLLVRVGDHDLTTNDVSREQYLKVVRILQHPHYNAKTTDSDISILRVKKRLSFSWRVSPICLSPEHLTYYREPVTVMGWGKKDPKDKVGSSRLHHTTLTILPMHKCRHNFKFESDEITSKMVCALRGTQDTCQGDSGGPLTWLDPANQRYFLIGITSWGIGCGLPDYPGVYTKVTKFLDWIYETTQDDVYCSSYSPVAQKRKIKERHRKKGKSFTNSEENEIKFGRKWKGKHKGKNKNLNTNSKRVKKHKIKKGKKVKQEKHKALRKRKRGKKQRHKSKKRQKKFRKKAKKCKDKECIEDE